jgi:hypothetical protein
MRSRMGATIERVIDRLLSTDTGRAMAQAITAEDLEHRRRHVAAIVDARSSLEAELERLGRPRRLAEDRVAALRVELGRAQLALEDVDHAIRAARGEADRRILVAERELRASAPAAIDEALRDLRHVEGVALSRTWGRDWLHESAWGDRREGSTNAPDVEAVVAAIRAAYMRIDALRLELAADVDDVVRASRTEVERVAVERGIRLEWPTGD